MTTTSAYDPGGRPRRLERSRDDRWIAGVCGGLGQYLGIDPVIVRLAFVAVTFVGGVGVIAYLAAFLLVPEQGNARPIIRTGGLPSSGRDRAWVIVGAVLLALGAIALLNALDLWWGGGIFWSLALLGGGVFLLLRYTSLGERFGVERAGRASAPTASPGSPPFASSSTAATSSPPETAFPGGPTAPGEDGPADGEEAGPGALAHGGLPSGDPLAPGTTAIEPLTGGTAPRPTEELPGRPAVALPAGAAPTEELPPGGFGPAGPETPPPLPPFPPRRPRRKRATGIALGAVLLVVGLGGVLLAAGAYDVRIGTFVAGAVVVTGLALVASAWFGGAPALIGLGLATAAVLGVLVAADIHLNGGAGTRVYRPANAASIKPTYELGAGELWIDLRGTELPQGTTRVEGDVGVGELTFVVPDGVEVQASGTAGVGNVRLFGRDQDGADVDNTLVSPGRAGAKGFRRLIVDGSVGLGEVRVYRASAAPSPPNGDRSGPGDQDRIGPPLGAGWAAATNSLGGVR
jgi:phage shock protein PspC (stress-responsive transcriptional regulator)